MPTDELGDVDDLVGELEQADPPQVDIEAVLIGTGFALLALTGHIDAEGKELLIASAHRTSIFYADSYVSYRDQMTEELEVCIVIGRW